jgi:hypothetical protein
MAEHSESAEQPRQVLVPVSQIGVLAEQVELSVHWTHFPLLAHTGAATLLAAHWPFEVHALQTLPVQIGVEVGQVELSRQETQRFALVSQKGVAPEHCELLVHWTHVPPPEQTARLGSPRAAHWAVVVHAPQVLVLVSQIGFAVEHWALETHCTHLLFVVLQAGVTPEQVLLSVHWTHSPLREHAGVAELLPMHWSG